MWFAELTAGDSLKIGEVLVTLEEKSGKRARVSISTDNQAVVTVIPKPEPKSCQKTPES